MQDPYGLDRENVRIVHIILETLDESMKLIQGNSTNSCSRNNSHSDKHSISSKNEFPIDADSQSSSMKNHSRDINNNDNSNYYCSKTFAIPETEAKLNQFRIRNQKS